MQTSSYFLIFLYISVFLFLLFDEDQGFIDIGHDQRGAFFYEFAR